MPPLRRPDGAPARAPIRGRAPATRARLLRWTHRRTRPLATLALNREARLNVPIACPRQRPGSSPGGRRRAGSSLYRSRSACNCPRGAGPVHEQGSDPRRDPPGDRRARTREAHVVGDRGRGGRLPPHALPMVPDQGRPPVRHRRVRGGAVRPRATGGRRRAPQPGAPARRGAALPRDVSRRIAGSRSDRRRPPIRAAIARPLASRPGRVAGTTPWRRIPASAGRAQRRVVERGGRGVVPAPRVLAIFGARSCARSAARQPPALRRSAHAAPRSARPAELTAAGSRAGSRRTRHAARLHPSR